MRDTTDAVTKFAGDWVYDDANLGYLEAAVRRTLGAVTRLVELNGGREPVLSPGRGCRICDAAATCSEAEPIEFAVAGNALVRRS